MPTYYLPESHQLQQLHGVELSRFIPPANKLQAYMILQTRY